MELSQDFSDFDTLKEVFLNLKEDAKNYIQQGDLSVAGTICNRVKARYKIVRFDKRFTVNQKRQLKEIQNDIKLITKDAFIRHPYNREADEYKRITFNFRTRKWFAEDHGMLESEANEYLCSFPGLTNILNQLPLDMSRRDVVDIITRYCYENGGSLVPYELQRHYKVGGQNAKHLYVIGNGFDRYHGAQSGYQQFRSYLFRKAPHIVSTFDLYFGPRSLEKSFAKPDRWWWCLQPYEYRKKILGRNYPVATWSRDHLWSDFENNLCELNREKVFDILDMFLPSVDEGEFGFKYCDYYLPLDQITDAVQFCTKGMKYHFHRWINTIHYSKGFRKRMLPLDRDALFLNFNYTLFLESEYGISNDNILYIHGCRRDKIGSLVLGHHVNDEEAFSRWIYKNKNRKRYRDVQKDHKGRYYKNDKLAYLAFFLKDERNGNWRLPIRYYAVNEAEQRLEKYYSANFKNTAKIIDANRGFFDSLSNIQTVTVIGHSLSEVDRLYFENIKNSISPDAVWEFSYHTDKDKQGIDKFCDSMGINKMNTKTMQL